MNVVGKVSSFITQGVYSVATPFHPFGGVVDIIVVQQQDGSFRSTPWYVRFGKFQGVLKGAEKVVRIEVNGVEANFHMYLDNSGEAYFVHEVVSDKEIETNGGVKDSDSLEGRQEDSKGDHADEDEGRNDDEFSRHNGSESGDGELQMRDERVTLGMERFERTGSDNSRFYEFQDEQSPEGSSVELSEYGSSHYDNLDNVEHGLESQTSSEVILVSVDGHVLTAPITSAEKNVENVELSTPRFNLGPVGGPDICEDTAEFSQGESASATGNLGDQSTSQNGVASADVCNKNYDISVVEHQLELHEDTENHYKMQEIEVAIKKSTVCTNTSTNNTSAIRRDEAFKSCLELSELVTQDRNENHQEMDPSSENHEIAENRKEQSLGSPKSTKEAENLNLGTTGNSYGLSVSGSDNPGYIASPALQGEVDHLENSTVDAEGNWPKCSPANSAGHDEKQEEHIDMPPAPESVQSGQQESALEVECSKTKNSESQTAKSGEDTSDSSFEISLCRNLLHSGMGRNAAAEVFDANRVSEEEYKPSATLIIKNENLVVRFRGKYLPWEKAAPVILGAAVYGVDLPVEANDAIPVGDEQMSETREDNSRMSSTPSGRRWRLWPIPFRKVKTLEHTSSNLSNEEVFVDTESDSQNQAAEPTPTTNGGSESPHKKLVRTNVPTSDQIASLNLKEGQNMVTFIFSTRVLGVQKVDAHIHLWKWNARIVISDVDGTITKSDVLGQFMPLVGKDWTHSGIARLFSAIKENGYQLLFLSARAIVQSYLTKSFLFNLKQDGKNLPTGPVVISPDGLFPSLYREVIRRAPHEFKIACLEDIKALFPPDYNPFYAGFGNRDTDELSYRKIGIPKGKIFIINPKGEVAINNRIDVKSYTSLHTLVHDMFPPTSLVEQEDYNSWNFWKMPLPDLDDL